MPLWQTCQNQNSCHYVYRAHECSSLRREHNSMLLYRFKGTPASAWLLKGYALV